MRCTSTRCTRPSFLAIRARSSWPAITGRSSAANWLPGTLDLALETVRSVAGAVCGWPEAVNQAGTPVPAVAPLDDWPLVRVALRAAEVPRHLGTKVSPRWAQRPWPFHEVTVIMDHDRRAATEEARMR
jgi:hypothetical protein